MKKAALLWICFGALLAGFGAGSAVLPGSGGWIKAEKIGPQEWATVNLDVGTFRNGDPISEAKTDEEWQKAGNEGRPAWCYYGNDPANGAKYGRLYNWYAVNDPRGLAPAGWHVFRDAEWNALIAYLGGEKVAGGKIKEAGTGHYLSPNVGATNESGFAGLPGGMRLSEDASFKYVGVSGIWWSATGSDKTKAEYRGVSNYHPTVFHNSGPKNHGFSVRCVRNPPE